MSQGYTLADLVQQVKALCGDSTQEGSAINADLRTLLALTQESLANTNDWAGLETTADVVLAAGDRFGVVPALNLARPVRVEYKWNEKWRPLTFGITTDDYNAWDEGETADPVEKWKLLPYEPENEQQQFEVWPSPVTEATIRFTGQKALATFEIDSDFATVDGLLLVYYTAAERLSLLGKKNAPLMLSKANALAATLRSVEHKDNNVISFTKYCDDQPQERRKFVRILSV